MAPSTPGPASAPITTDILFNSPALHSLKRAQLVQLCKRHELKATGKNTELIARLKGHALGLAMAKHQSESEATEDNERTIQHHQDESASDDEQDQHNGDVSWSDDCNVDPDFADTYGRPQRPSELWEVVMDDIPEEDERSRPPSKQSSLRSKFTSKTGTVSSTKSVETIGVQEFGASVSMPSTKSSSSVTSSLRALATSIGLTRSTGLNNLVTSTSSSSVPPLPTASGESDSLNKSSSLRRVLGGLGASTSNLLSNTNSSNPRDSLTAHAVPYSNIPPSRESMLPYCDDADMFQNQDTDLSMQDADGAGEEGEGDVSMMSTDATSLATSDGPLPGHKRSKSKASNYSGLGHGFGAGIPSTIRLVSIPTGLPSTGEEGNNWSSTFAATTFGGPSSGAKDGTNATANTYTVLSNPSLSSFTQPSTPQLKPFKPAFDLLMPTPGKTYDEDGNATSLLGGSGAGGLRKWPMSPGGNVPPVPSLSGSLANQESNRDKTKGGIYPSLHGLTSASSTTGPAFTSSRPLPVPPQTTSLLSPPSAVPAFQFGSPNPHPRHSTPQDSRNAFSDAAKSILDEMNRRMGADGSSTAGPGNNGLLQRVVAGPSNGQDYTSTTGKRAHGPDAPAFRFERAHEVAFEKMDSIADHWSVKQAKRAAIAASNADPSVEGQFGAGKKRKSDALGGGIGGDGARKRPSVATKPNPGLGTRSTTTGRRSGTRVISAGAARKMKKAAVIPGGFGDEDDEESDDELREADNIEEDKSHRRLSKRPRVSEMHVSIRDTQARQDDEDSSDDEDANNRQKEGERIRKEREAIKRKLDYNKAKRRSSMAAARRSSIAARKSIGKQQKVAPSRFGFLSSAKSLVKSVWNRGAGGTTTSASAANATASGSVRSSTRTTGSKAPAPRKPAVLVKPNPANSGTANSKQFALGHGKPPGHVHASSNASLRSGSGPLLKVDQGTMRSSRTVSSSTTASSARARSPIPSFGTAGGAKRIISTSTNTNALTRKVSGSGVKNPSVASRTSSVGAKESLGSRTGVSSEGSRMSAVGRQRPSSTLFAPTASSLAKMQTPHRLSNVQNQNKPAGLGSIREKRAEATNSMDVDEVDTIKRSGVPSSPSKLPIPVTSPRQFADGKKSIFSQPLSFGPENTGTNPITGLRSPPVTSASPSRIPLAQASINATSTVGSSTVGSTKSPGIGTERTNDSIGVKRQPSRRPRISRSKVIAKLGAQRAAANSGNSSSSSISASTYLADSGSTTGPGAGATSTLTLTGASATGGGKRIRSSVGAAVSSSKVSGLGIGARKSSGLRPTNAALLSSAKKRARQSEYARRRSARAQSGVGVEMGQ